MQIRARSVWVMHHEPAASHIPQDDQTIVSVIDFLHADRVRVCAPNGESYILYASAFIGDETEREMIPITVSYYCTPLLTPTACAACNRDGGTVGVNPLCVLCGGCGWLNGLPVMGHNAADFHRLRLKLRLAYETNLAYAKADETGIGNASELLAESERLLIDAMIFAGVAGNLAGKS